MGRTIDRAGAYVPKTCTWELTLRCNLDCGHCGSRAGRPRHDEMDEATALRVMGELAALGCEKVTLSGGEPTLSPYWEALAVEGARLGVRVNMITNGLAADRGLVKRARAVGLRGLGVSLDGLEEAHDRLRGRRGMYRRVMDLLDDGAAEGLPIGVITTIWKGNLDDLETMAELLEGRVYVWQVQLGESMGNLKDRGFEQVTPRDLLEIVPTLARIATANRLPLRVADNIGYYGPHEPRLRSKPGSAASRAWRGCKAGLRHLGIEADGGVKGCLSLQSVKTTEGNLQREALADIWFREGAFAYNRSFSLDDLAGFCRRCSYAQLCRGGCTSARTCEGGVDNPFCYHRVEVLAREKERAWVRRVVSQALAPAALATLVSLSWGCHEEPDAYGLPDADGDGDIDADAYGMPDADTDDGGVDYYGMPDADLYGLDADPDGIDYYGMPDADADDGGADWYGVPDADADDGGADWYGMPDADADADADADTDDGGADYYGLPE
jgi:radical SAM protein with 4Fe4S-binding SPASM domain